MQHAKSVNSQHQENPTQKNSENTKRAKNDKLTERPAQSTLIQMPGRAKAAKPRTQQAANMILQSKD